MMRFALCFFLIFSWQIATNAAPQIPQTAQPLTAEQKRLVHLCHAMYVGRHTDFWKDAQKARAEFKELPHRNLYSKLEPCRRALPFGSVAYRSVAYVLALHNISPRANYWRMLNGRPPRQDDLRDIAEEIHARQAEIYRATHDYAILGDILKTRSDGAGSTVLRGERLRLFFDDPVTVLRVAGHKSKRLETLAEDSWYDGGRRWKTELLKMTQHRDSVVAQSARYCLKVRRVELNELGHLEHIQAWKKKHE